MRTWLVAVLVVLALAAGLAVDQLLLCPRRVQEAEDRAGFRLLQQEGQIADLRRRLEQAEARARMEAEQRRIAEEVIQREKLWK